MHEDTLHEAVENAILARRGARRRGRTTWESRDPEKPSEARREAIRRRADMLEEMARKHPAGAAELLELEARVLRKAAERH